jgi:hypothetical protein
MTTDRAKTPFVIGLALALLATAATRAAGARQADASLVPRAIAFVRTLAKGDFEAAEADFTVQMKQDVPPAKLREVWQSVVAEIGPFQDTGNSQTVVQDGYTNVIVRTDFKSRALGTEVSFDSAGSRRERPATVPQPGLAGRYRERIRSQGAGTWCARSIEPPQRHRCPRRSA